MCVRHHHDSYKCCCCLPLIVGVAFIFMINLLDFASAVVFEQWIYAALEGTISVLFIITFIKNHSHKFRLLLFRVYLIAFILGFVYMIYFALNNSKDLAEWICDFVGRIDGGDACSSTIQTHVWYVIVPYYFVVTLISLAFLHVLHCYAKEAEHGHGAYNKLAAAINHH